jgi:hypothetical protein
MTYPQSVLAQPTSFREIHDMHTLASLASILTFATSLAAQCGTASLATRTDGNTSFGVGGGNFFDVSVLNPVGILVCAIDTKTTAPLNTPITVNVYSTPGTYVGVQQIPAAWRLIATGTGTGKGSLQPPVAVALAAPFYLAAGNHGLFVQLASGGGPQYTQGLNNYANADLSITLGQSQSMAFSSAPAASRTWNGTFYYSTCTNGGEAGYGFIGIGCPGAMPVATLRHTNRPVLGQSLAVTIDNLPSSAAIMVLGFSNTMSTIGPLPFDLGVINAPGCKLYVSPDVPVTVVGSNNTAVFTLPVPNNPALQCLKFWNQAVTLDPGANGLGLVVSDAHAGVIGK